MIEYVRIRRLGGENDPDTVVILEVQNIGEKKLIELGREKLSENFSSGWSLIKSAGRMQDMTEPELSEHLNRQLRVIKRWQTADTVGSMLVIFQDDGITQYGATIDPETAPDALRELADRIERRETVKR